MSAPLTVQEAARVALRYAETLWDIDQGENTPDLFDDLNRIRAALDETSGGRVGLIVHQYLGTLRESMAKAYNVGEDFVASMPGFDVLGMISRDDIPGWVDDLSAAMDEALGLSPEDLEAFKDALRDDVAGEEWKKGGSDG